MEPTYRIYPLISGETVLHKSVFLYLIPNLREMVIPAMFFYIEGADKRILVDTGGSGEELRKWSQFGAPWKDISSFEDCLGRVGIAPGDVDIVIQTHLHFDHVLNTKRCHNAKVYVQKAELAQAQDPHPLTAKMYRWFDSEGRDFDYVTVDGDFELMPGIDLLSVPGHAVGCQAVAINTARGKAIISGYCSINDNHDPPASLRSPFPVICPGIHFSSLQAYESTWRVKREADVIIPMHEPGLASVEFI